MTAILCALAMQAVFHVESRLVVVDVTVRGVSGAAVANLDKTAFTVYEDGKRQPIAVFMGENVPVSVGIVIDNSGSMRERRSKVEAAALAFARASNPMDEMFVVNFADRARVDVPLTGDVKALEAGIARGDAIGGTALRDAVDLAETYLAEHATRDRKVLLVITDGNDNASTISADRVRKQAGQHDIAVYAIGLPHQNPSMAAHARRELDELTESTGGLARHVASMAHIGRFALRSGPPDMRQCARAPATSRLQARRKDKGDDSAKDGWRGALSDRVVGGVGAAAVPSIVPGRREGAGDAG